MSDFGVGLIGFETNFGHIEAMRGSSNIIETIPVLCHTEKRNRLDISESIDSTLYILIPQIYNSVHSDDYRLIIIL